MDPHVEIRNQICAHCAGGPTGLQVGLEGCAPQDDKRRCTSRASGGSRAPRPRKAFSYIALSSAFSGRFASPTRAGDAPGAAGKQNGLPTGPKPCPSPPRRRAFSLQRCEHRPSATRCSKYVVVALCHHADLLPPRKAPMQCSVRRLSPPRTARAVAALTQSQVLTCC